MRLVLLQQFYHHAVGDLGMDESYEAVDALSRGLVDQADASSAEFLKSVRDVGDGNADVVAAFAPTRQKAGSAAFIVGRREEFDRTAAGVKKCDLDSVVRCVEPFQETKAKSAAVGGEGVVDVLDDDADVVDLGVG